MKFRGKPKPKPGYMAAHNALYGAGEVRNPAAQGRTDANQSEIVKAFEELYCKVIDTHKVGGGFGDLCVKITTRWGNVMKNVEVKTLDGELRPSQKRFKEEWGDCVEVVSTRNDVFNFVQRVRERGR